MVSCLICDHWWHLKLVVLKCHWGWASVKIKDDIMWLENLQVDHSGQHIIQVSISFRSAFWPSRALEVARSHGLGWAYGAAAWCHLRKKNRMGHQSTPPSRHTYIPTSYIMPTSNEYGNAAATEQTSWPLGVKVHNRVLAPKCYYKAGWCLGPLKETR